MNKLQCIVCRKASIFSSESSLIECTNCGVIICRDKISETNYKEDSYESYNSNFFENIIIYINFYWVNFLKLNKKNATWLDFGSGKGKLLKIVPNKFHKYGVEPIKERFCISKKILPNAQLLNDYYHKGKIFDSKMDVISVTHVLEHLENPQIILNLLNENLKKSGLGIIEVPNLNSWQYIISKENWIHLDRPYHRINYTKKALFNLFLDNGFLIKKYYTFSLINGVLGMSASIIGIFTNKKNLFTLLKKSSFYYLIFFPFFIIGFLLELISSLFGKGGVLRIYVTK